MAVTFVNAQSNQNGTGSTSILVTKPTGLQDNDVLIATVVAKGTTNTASLPSGFTEIANTITSAGSATGRIGYKVVTDAAGEDASYSFAISPSAKAAASVLAYRGLNTSDPIAASWFVDVGATSTPYFTYLQHPYRPHTMAFFTLGGGTGTTTFGSADAVTNPIVKRVDVTNSGGGSGTSKVSIGVADALVNPKEYIDPNNGIIYAYGSWYNASTTWSNGTISGMLVLNDAAASAVGSATTLDTSASIAEIRVQPLAWTSGVNTARTSSAGGGEDVQISNPDVAFEVINEPGRFIGIYSEWNYVPAYIERRQAGKAITFKNLDGDYSRWGETESTYEWQGQYYGADANDVMRLDDNTFAVMYSNGHAGAYDGDGGTYGDGAYWTSPDGIYIDLLRISGSTITNVASTSVGGNTNYMGTLSRGGPNTIIISNSSSNAAPATYGAYVWAFNGTAWAIGARYNYASDGRSATYQVQVSHVPDSKIVFFYYDSTLGYTVARVGNLSNDVNGRPTVITYGSEYQVPNSTGLSYTLACKPIALSETRGVLLHNDSVSTLNTTLIPYTISGDVITFDSPIVVNTHSGSGLAQSDTSSMLLRNNKLYIVHTHYRYVTWNNYGYTPRRSIYDYDSGTGALVHDETIDLYPESTSQRVAKPTLSHGTGPYYHLNYFDGSVGYQTPLLRTFTVPITEVETDNTNDISAYINVSAPVPFNHTQPAMCFIQTEGIYAGQGAYLAAPATPVDIPRLDAYIWGLGEDTETVLAYITYAEDEESYLNCFIQAGAEEAPGLLAWMSGPAISDNEVIMNVLLYGEGKIDANQGCFIDGLRVVGDINKIGAIQLGKANSQRIEFNDVNGIRPTQELTMNFWMKGYDLSDGSYPAFIEKDYGGSQSIGIYEAATGLRKWHYGIYTNGVWSATNSIADYIPDTWYMVTLRYNGMAVTLSINGQTDSSFAKTGDIQWDTGVWSVGYRPNTGEYTNMAFAKFDLWNYYLTDQEVEQLYAYIVERGVGCFIEGGSFEATDKMINAYLVSNTNASNPLVVESSVSLDFAIDGIGSNHSCFIVAPTVNREVHDLQIVIDRFRIHKNDMILRINGQGPTVLTKVLGAIDYPITREATTFLEGVYFKDMPGKGRSNTLAFLHSGFFADISPQKVFISGPTGQHANISAFLNAAFVFAQGTKSAYIVNNHHTVSTLAYIQVREIEQRYSTAYAFIVSDIDGQESDGVESFIHGAGKVDDSQRAFIQTGEIQYGSAQLYIHCGDVLSTVAPRQMAHIMASALSFDPALNLFVFGVYVAGQEVGDGQLTFLHAQPTVEATVSCYVAAARPEIPRRPANLFIAGNQPTVVSQLAHIHAALFVVPAASRGRSYIKGRDIKESSRRAYIVNIEIFNMTARGQRAFIPCEAPVSSTKSCFITGTGDLYSVVDARLSSGDEPIPREKFKNCMIVGAGSTPDTVLTCYIFGTVGTTGNEGNDLFGYIVG